MKFANFILLILAVILLNACVSRPDPVPVVERQPGSYIQEAETIGQNQIQRTAYTLQRGDTLYSIALRYGLDVNQLMEINNITDPRNLSVGQIIYLYAHAKEAPSVLDDDTQPRLFSISQSTDMGESDQRFGTLSAESSGSLKTEPKGTLLPYSDAAIAKLNEQSNAAVSEAEKNTSSAVYKEEVAEKSDQNTAKQSARSAASGVNWGWPTSGQVVSRFSEKSKGIGIAGASRQAVLASASGEVVYSGNGLRGYGNLVIIKHNDTFLSAYGHNSRVFVHEGEKVSKGQKIAEMGNADSETVKLHFEIREKGKPVDPLAFLPAR